MAEERVHTTSARMVAVFLGALGAALLLLGILLATLPVHVPREGDSSPYRCSPFTSAFSDAPGCADHVGTRLATSAVSAVAGGVVEGIAMLVALGLAGAAPDGTMP